MIKYESVDSDIQRVLSTHKWFSSYSSGALVSTYPSKSVHLGEKTPNYFHIYFKF
jgi:hypothetical protein